MAGKKMSKNGGKAVGNRRKSVVIRGGEGRVVMCRNIRVGDVVKSRTQREKIKREMQSLSVNFCHHQMKRKT